MTEFADMAYDIAFGLLSKAVRALVRKREGGLTFHQYIAYEGMRDYQSGLKAVDIQNLLPSTSKTCRRFARKHATSIRTIKLQDGTNVPWLGRRDASRVLVLLHGGGYMAPALPSHLSFAFGFLEPADGDVSVVVLPYGMSSALFRNVQVDLSKFSAVKLSHPRMPTSTPASCSRPPI